MSVKWIKDVDSGELFPIVDEEEEFNIPEHLRVSEHTAIDYEKTTKNTIADLQEQLTAAQEKIDVYKKTQPVELSKDIPKEIQQHSTLTDKPKHFIIGKSWILLIVVCVLASLLGVFCVKRLSDDGYRFPTTVAQQEATEADEETEVDESEESKEGFEVFLPLLYVGLSVLGVQHSIRFIRHTIEGA